MNVLLYAEHLEHLAHMVRAMGEIDGVKLDSAPVIGTTPVSVDGETIGYLVRDELGAWAYEVPKVDA